MKLINKQTGEIATLTLSSNGEELLLMKNNEMVTRNVKLSDLEDWQDYEEPKGKWFISNNGQIHNDEEHERFREERKLIGNYFETKEEAEKAVDKLKAWKRLKDKGFRFCGWATNEGIRGVDFEVPDSFFSEHNHSCISDETKDDLDLLFGGEE